MEKIDKEKFMIHYWENSSWSQFDNSAAIQGIINKINEIINILNEKELTK